MSYFIQNYKNIEYPVSGQGTSGLRNAQLGAIHSIASFHTLQKKKAGLITMPTGSGKTAVLMMTPYIVHAKKVLVVTPSTMVRGQIYEDFSLLSTLITAGVFKKTISKPKVFELKHKFKEELTLNIEKSDVIIATPQCALSVSESLVKNLFDLVLIDEAHHTPAQTWQKILLNMNDAEQYLFTATPFRLDKKEVKGEMLYSYPLSMAYKDGIFGAIKYISISEAPNKDRCIAKEAETVFRNDQQQGYEHFLMVRTDTKEKAIELERLYKSETSLNLKRIDSSMSFQTIESCIKVLKSGEIDGIICVDMLGEGFDFPNLKIAAVHEPHKSLASTLQFIGRFARTNAQNIGTAKFIAMDNEELKIENRRLFTEDSVWQDIIIDMSEQAINREETIQKSLDNFRKDANDLESDEIISLYSLRPNCHAKVYMISGFNIDAIFPDFCFVDNRVYRNFDNNTVVGIGKMYIRPRWIESDQAMNIENLLFIVHYQQETSLLFIYSQMKSINDYEILAQAFTSEFENIPRNEIHRVLGGLANYEMFNTGISNRFIETGESYRISAGSNVANSIDRVTGKMYAAGHVFCKALTESAVDITIGYSSGSKIWSSSYMTIPEYINWCDTNGKKIINSKIHVVTNTNYDYLPLPTRLITFPKKIFFVFFSEKTYSLPPVVFRNANNESTNTILTDAMISLERSNKDEVLFSINIEGLSDDFIYKTDGKYYCEDPTIRVKVGSDALTLKDYLNRHPLKFKTTNDTLIEGNSICTGNSDAIAFDPEQIQGIDWNQYRTDLKCEFKSTAGGKFPRKGKISIQDALLKILEDKDDYTYLLFDHGTGEIADYISICDEKERIEVSLYHVKSMNGNIFNSQVVDIYEVTQQAVKSIIWLKSESTLREKIKQRRKSNNCKLLKGQYKDLDKILKASNKDFKAKIIVVQPAISKSQPLPDKYQEVLAATSFYLKNSGRVGSFQIMGSP